MQFAHEIDVTPSNTASNPVIRQCKLSVGVLMKISTLFEVGDGYSTCVQYWTQGFQLIPSNTNSFLCGDAVLIESPTWLDLSENTDIVYVVAWNRGGIYDHSVNVMFDVRSVDEPDLHSVIATQNDLIDRLITTIRSFI